MYQLIFYYSLMVINFHRYIGLNDFKSNTCFLLIVYFIVLYCFNIKGAISSRSTGHGIGVLVLVTENNTPHDKVLIITVVAA